MGQVEQHTVRELARRGMMISVASAGRLRNALLSRVTPYSTPAGFYSIRPIAVCQYQALFDPGVMIHEIERGAAAELFLFRSL